MVLISRFLSQIYFIPLTHTRILLFNAHMFNSHYTVWSKCDGILLLLVTIKLLFFAYTTHIKSINTIYWTQFRIEFKLSRFFLFTRTDLLPRFYLINEKQRHMVQHKKVRFAIIRRYLCDFFFLNSLHFFPPFFHLSIKVCELYGLH